MNVLVLDVGTSSMRGILFSAEGAALASAQCPYRADYMEDDGVEHILKYGIACYKKRCRVMLAEKHIK